MFNKRLSNQKYYQKNREKLLSQQKIRDSKNKHNIHIRNQKRKNDNKIKVLTHYGNDTCACVRCGVEDIRVLSLDHIYNNGYEERRRTGWSGHEFYRQLIIAGFPEGYQTLCMNCQWIKRYETHNN